MGEAGGLFEEPQPVPPAPTEPDPIVPEQPPLDPHGKFMFYLM